MVGDHCIKGQVRDVAKVTLKVLGIVGEVLAGDEAIRVGQEVPEDLHQVELLGLEPVTARRGLHEGDAKGVVFRPPEADTGDVACSRLYVNCYVDRPSLDSSQQGLNDGVGLDVMWRFYESVRWHIHRVSDSGFDSSQVADNIRSP